MAGGGSRPGERRGGRKPGSANKRTTAREAALAEVAQRIESLIGEGVFTGDPVAFLLAIYKDPAWPIDLRVDCAKAAANYVAPRLTAATLTVKNPWDGMTVSQLENLRQLAANAAGIADAPEAIEDGTRH